MLNDLITMFMLLVVLGVLYVVNTVLGVLLKTQGTSFDIKIFAKGLLKALVIALVAIGFCFCVEVTPLILERVGITIAETNITLIEVFTVGITAYKKYATDCYNKIKKLFEI